MKCVLYARVSTDDQRTFNMSLDDQMRAMRRYVHERGWFIFSEVRESWSGFEYDREYMDAIREEAKKRAFDVLIVLRTDRFARDEAVFLLLERFFKKHNVRLFSVEEGEFTPGVINRFLAAIQRAKAQDDAEMSKKRMKEGRHSYLRSNVPQSQGYALYGYTRVGKKKETRYVINEEEAIIVRLIYDLFTRERLTYYTIAMQLNDSAVSSPVVARRRDSSKYHGKWYENTVREILKNPAYKGNLKGMKWRWVDGKEIKTATDEQTDIQIPAIVTVKQWEQAQYLVNTKTSKKSVKNYLLSGMTKCVCGCPMYGCSVSAFRKRKNERYYQYFYRCNSYNKLLARAGCANKHVSALNLEYTVWDFVEKLIRNPKTTLALYQKDQEAKQALLLNVQERVAAIDDLLEDNTGELRRLQKMYQRGGCDEEYFDAEKKRIDDERGALERERQKAQRLVDRNRNAIAQLAELEEIGEEVRSNLLGMTDTKRRRIYERVRLAVTVEKPTGNGQWVVIEVLGNAERIRVKNASAP
jgi:site-specific DNA recombinase